MNSRLDGRESTGTQQQTGGKSMRAIRARTIRKAVIEELFRIYGKAAERMNYRKQYRRAKKNYTRINRA
jgi:hypothetical protein